MKHLYNCILFRIIPVIAAIMAFAGCNSVIYDDEGDCDPIHVIRFNYDWNMKFTNAFPAEVLNVELHVFDSNGTLVRVVSEHVSRENAADYNIELRGLAPGNYSFLAWCGTKDSEHFTINHQGVASPMMEHHTCRINSLDEEDDVNGHIRQDIGRLFHGRLDNVDMTADEGRHEHVIRLKKNTNVVRVVLQHMNGEPMDKDDYIFRITDSNGLYDHNNDLLPHRELTYHPWVIKSGQAAFHPEDQPEGGRAAAVSGVSAVVAELTVGRLMSDHEKTATLTVHSRDGHLILSIPLIEYMLLVKGHYYGEDGHTPMSDQEYLDRQDEYPMTFFLDQSHEWIKTVIYINDWRIVRDTPTIH
ncbi:MAG: FimB/Mfa2 family fimbrial subunit [Paramuribaculum sp.]|nr:FimB/Mfa2 family fimbrial subunit [Paramuribaculum sp.]MDE7449132.1 FimB/Mfa2 family fimbrial subunit [Paramuribaculum sp.]